MAVERVSSAVDDMGELTAALATCINTCLQIEATFLQRTTVGLLFVPACVFQFHNTTCAASFAAVLRRR